MTKHFSIGRKIGFGFGILLALTFIVFFSTNQTLERSREINYRINNIYNPSVAALEKLKSSILRTRMLITNWAFVQSREDTDEKMTLLQITSEELPQIKATIDELSLNWDADQIEQKRRIYTDLEELLLMYDVVKEHLPNMRSYDDAFAQFMIRDFAEEGGEIDNKAKQIINDLNVLISSQRKETESDSVFMIKAFDELEVYIRNFGIALIILGVIIAILTVRSIVRPISKLKRVILSLSKGVFPETVPATTNDEIGEMAVALDQLVTGMKRTTQFSFEVGKGNFDTEYKPLSSGDVLGHALLKMRGELKENERVLEQKVVERTLEVVEQKEKIEKQNRKLVELYKNVTDSIRYAKRLQENILPSPRRIKDIFNESFIFFKPKDIVSGDFYYFQEINDKVVFAAVDCTGHGVPGAFMSLVGYNSLNQAIKEAIALEPSLILNNLNTIAAKTLNKSNEENSVRDGMDIALCVIDKKNFELQYAGAYCPLYLVRDGRILETRADKMPIGSIDMVDARYTNHKIKLEKNDIIYLFSDGYADQFGGPLGKKFLYWRFRELLIRIHTKEMSSQIDELQTALLNWKGDLEQVDDILVMGIKV